ncbi:hypothetical protein CHS0354_019450 [Potamilus streckersoni]|uniref:Superoxide dismutase copper/zinc binding domain-containing protein n=1 Tax=Potamilus streckersoni TaxID=2493646 RepID=A0AAE0SI56_9BIVA|nr:hypothetical protein CHS0354_019450 [Potamilus streckersoni]
MALGVAFVSTLLCVSFQVILGQGPLVLPVPGPGVPDGVSPFGPAGGAPPLVLDRFVYGTCYFNNTFSTIRGRVDIRQDNQIQPPRLDVRVQVVGLEQTLMSDMEHGLHVHEWGDVSNNCYNAGPHFDTDQRSFHGGPNGIGRTNRHDGDWGNLKQSNAGVINTQFQVQGMSLIGDIGIQGRAIVLKEGRDDLGRGGNPSSLQTGNSGRPISCCPIGLADATNWNNPLIQNGQFVGSTNGFNTFNSGLNGMNGMNSFNTMNGQANFMG